MVSSSTTDRLTTLPAALLWSAGFGPTWSLTFWASRFLKGPSQPSLSTRAIRCSRSWNTKNHQAMSDQLQPVEATSWSTCPPWCRTVGTMGTMGHFLIKFQGEKHTQSTKWLTKLLMICAYRMFLAEHG